jgi:hypothetical protein
VGVGRGSWPATEPIGATPHEKSGKYHWYTNIISVQYLWFCFRVSILCRANSNHIFVPRDEYRLHHRQILERSVLIAIYCMFQINLNFWFLQSAGFSSSRLKSLLTFSAPGMVPKQPTKWLDVVYRTASRMWWKLRSISNTYSYFTFMLPRMVIDFFLITNQTH